MIKLLKQYQIQVTPFGVTKNWNLNNSDNENLLLFESTGSDDGLPIALEFIDYGDGTGYPKDNSFCDIAIEQQTNNLATSQTGLNVKGIVNMDTEPTNDDGTYKRSIYHQVKTMFYNNYLNPSKIWGIENIDFTLSQTQRNLSDQFRLIGIPKNVYGDKIVPKTVRVYNNTLDNVYTINDDGNGNLFAGKNLFSHQQELGEYINQFISYLSSSYCDDYWATNNNNNDNNNDIKNQPLRTDTASLSVNFSYGGLDIYPTLEPASVTLGFISGSLLNTTFEEYLTSSGSLTLGFVSGHTTDTTITSLQDDTSSVTLGFSSGSIVLTTLQTSSIEDGFVSLAFVSGSRQLTTFLLTKFDSMSITVGFYQGSLM